MACVLAWGDLVLWVLAPSSASRRKYDYQQVCLFYYLDQKFLFKEWPDYPAIGHLGRNLKLYFCALYVTFFLFFKLRNIPHVNTK